MRMEAKVRHSASVGVFDHTVLFFYFVTVLPNLVNFGQSVIH